MTEPSARQIEAQQLAAVRARHAAASTDWQRGPVAGGEGLLARLIPQQEPTPVFIFDPWTDRNDIAFGLNAHADIAFLLALIDRAISAHRKANPPQKPPPDYAAECAMKCGERAFQRWLHEVHGLDHPWDAARAATKVRGLLAISSRAELNTDPAAAQRWRAMVADFERWIRGTP